MLLPSSLLRTGAVIAIFSPPPDGSAFCGWFCPKRYDATWRKPAPVLSRIGLLPNAISVSAMMYGLRDTRHA